MISVDTSHDLGDLRVERHLSESYRQAGVLDLYPVGALPPSCSWVYLTVTKCLLYLWAQTVLDLRVLGIRPLGDQKPYPIPGIIALHEVLRIWGRGSSDESFYSGFTPWFRILLARALG